MQAATITIDGQTDVFDDIDGALPNKFHLSSNFPNPFNQETIWEVELPREENLRLEIFNLLGQRVSVLYSGPKEAGRFRIRWDGKIPGRVEAPTGIYFCRMQAEDFVQVRKLLLIR